jgi:serine/threonine-protein kinase
MAPEQLRGAVHVDARTDIWALAVVLHELLAGQPPFRGDSVPELCAAILMQEPVRVSAIRANVPLGVELAILRALQKNPAARFASVAEFAQALAPYGTALARASHERIERVLGGSTRRSESSFLPPLPFEHVPSYPPISDPWVDARRIAGVPPSGKIVFGALFMLAGLGAGAFMWLYASVHSPNPSSVGAAQLQAPLPHLEAVEPALEPSSSAQHPGAVAPTARPSGGPIRPRWPLAPPAVGPTPSPRSVSTTTH